MSGAEIDKAIKLSAEYLTKARMLTRAELLTLINALLEEALKINEKEIK